MNESTYLSRMAAAEKTLYRIACGMLSAEHDRQDALQETAAICWQRRNSLRQEEYFTTWSARILINVCKSMYRRSRRLRPMLEAMPELPAADNMGDVELRLSIKKLEPKLRVVIVMHYLEGFSLKEMADILCIPMGTVKYRLHQARKALRVEIDEEKEASI